FSLKLEKRCQGERRTRSGSERIRNRSIPFQGKFSEQSALLTFSLRSSNSLRQGCIRNSSENHCDRADRIPTPPSSREASTKAWSFSRSAGRSSTGTIWIKVGTSSTTGSCVEV